MNILIRIVEWARRLIGYALVTVLIAILGAVLVFGFAPFGARIAADQIARMISTPDQTITITDPQGLLTGKLRVGAITLADSKGVYAEVRDLAVDWSPLSLLDATFDAQRISAGTIELLRAPVREKQSEPASASTGFNLPVAIDIAQIYAPDIRLGSELAGKTFELAAEGRAKATKERVELALTANGLDQPEARASADILFAPAENRLTLNTVLAEPQGGLLARLLQLPGEPAIKIDLDGQGPLSDWTGKLVADVDGQPVLSVDGRHQMPGAGIHHVDLKGGGTLDTLLPPNLRPLFAGDTSIDLALTVNDTGSLSIESGDVRTGSFLLAASGNFNPAGGNNLKANLLGTSGPVDFRWPMTGGEARLLIDNLDLSLSGDAGAAALDLTAALQAVETPDGRFNDIHLSAKSDSFDLSRRSGPVHVELAVEQTAFTDPDLERAIRGPLKLVAPLKISPTEIAFDEATLESGGIGGTASGRYDLAATTLTSNFRLFAVPDALPEVVAARFDDTIAISGKISAIVDGPVDLSDFTLKSTTLDAAGNVAMADGNVKADLSGRLLQLGKLIDNATGEADFNFSASGPVNALAVKANATAERATLAGRELQALEISVDGTVSKAAPQATVKASGSLDGQKIDINANLVSADGETRIPELVAIIGPNRLAGDMRFSRTFEPSGNLDFDLPDIGLIAALAGQKASGDLKGSLVLGNTEGRIGATIKATGSGIRRDDIIVSKPDIDLVIDDLKAVSARGTVRLAELASGANKVSDLAVDFRQTGNTTDFDLKASYDGAPLLVAGSAEAGAGATTVALRSFSAKPRGIPVELKAPSSVTIKDGVATLSKLAVGTGSGSVTIDGTAGQTLDIAATIADLPASLANTFMPDLGAEGAISGSVNAKGNASDPDVTFDLAWAKAVVSQSRAAGPIDIKAKGQFAARTLKIDTTVSGRDGLSLTGGGTVQVAEDPMNSNLDVTARIANLPASLANAFVPDLGAEGALSGNVTAKGKAKDPTIGFDLALAKGAVRQTRDAGLLDVKAKGQFVASTLKFDTTVSGRGGLSLTGDGTVAVAKVTNSSVLDIKARVANLPASVANGFVPGLAAEGTITGNVTAKGRITEPAVDFDLAWAKAVVSQTRSAGLPPLEIKAKGNLAANVLKIDANVTGQNGLALTGGGTLALAGNKAIHMRFTGGLPFAVLSGQLAGHGLTADGTARIDLNVGGTTAAPAITGNITTDRAKLTDVRRNLALNDLAATVNFDRNRATISRLSAKLSSGGTLSGTGSVGIAPGSGFPADITLTLAKANYVDGTLFSALTDGTLTLKGPLLTAPVLGGSLKIAKASINIPERLPASLSEIDIKHRNAPARVTAQLKDTTAERRGTSSSPVGLDLTISAPSKIFVRGRGIDAELSGNLTVRGTAAAPVVSGGFEMRRGRMVILNRRLDFTSGRITFSGDLTPMLDMNASSTVGSTTITVSVTGLASDPKVTFSSSPALPQDEVLAQLIFGQSMSKLSALQIAQLADAASQLAGGRSTSLFQSLRSNLGIDDLDISTDEKGRAKVSAGKYLNDRTYLELQQGGDSGGKAIINLDVGRGVKLRGEAGANGSGAAGIFYEKEY